MEHASDRNMVVGPELSIMCALCILWLGAFQCVSGDLINIHCTTTGRILHQFMHAINCLRAQYVLLTTTPHGIASAKKCYHTEQFPGVIGAIDCARLPFLCQPGPNAEIFHN